MELRDKWAAFSVAGDGNCFWRVAAHGLWASDYFWLQTKLVVLAYAAEHFQELVGEGRHLHECQTYYDNDVLDKYKCLVDGRHIFQLDDYEMMLLKAIQALCPNAVWGGGLTAHLASEALGIRVKLLNPIDTMSRKKQDAAGTLPRGTGKHGLGLGTDDQRLSRTFVPHSAQSEWCVRGVNGTEDTYREEVAMIFVEYGPGVLESELLEVSEVGKDTEVAGLNHFASVMRKDGSSTPFPLYLCAPSMLPILVSDIVAVCHFRGCQIDRASSTIAETIVYIVLSYTRY